MDELTFLLILAGIGVTLLVAMFTYYKHHKQINDEIKDFNHHVNDIDDFLLHEHSNGTDQEDSLTDDLPGSFSASRKEDFDVDDVFIKHDKIEKSTHTTAATSTTATTKPHTMVQETSPADKEKQQTADRELVDGVYINSKRVISQTDPKPVNTSYENTKSLDAFSPLGATPDLAEEPEKKQASVIKAAEKAMQNESSKLLEEAEQTKVETSQSQASVAESTANTSSSDETKHTSEQNIRIVYDPLPEGVEELIISHTILSRGEYFSGVQLFQALATAGLSYGEMNIFHYPGNEENDTFALFSVANVIEPGTFNLEEPQSLSTPGISMFMRLPTRLGSYEAYEEFIHVAQMIAAELDGELCDETRSQLTQQAIGYKKEQIRKLNFAMAKAEKLAGSSH